MIAVACLAPPSFDPSTCPGPEERSLWSVSQPPRFSLYTMSPCGVVVAGCEAFLAELTSTESTWTCRNARDVHQPTNLLTERRPWQIRISLRLQHPSSSSLLSFLFSPKDPPIPHCELRTTFRRSLSSAFQSIRLPATCLPNS